MDFELRARPTQKRSAKTFDHILDTAVHVLEKEGWAGFNTNLLAERAGIGVQTLYRYFPNKESIIATLAERVINEWDEWFEDFDGFFEDGYDEGMQRAFLLFIDKLKNQPGGVAIRRAMAVSPDLRKLDRDDNRRMAKGFAEAISRKMGKGNVEDHFFAFLTSIEASVAITDFVFDLPDDEAEKVIREFIIMQQAFLTVKMRTFENELKEEL